MNNIDFMSKEYIGFRFLIFRKALRKSQMELADEIGVPLADIQAMENGSSYPDIEFMHNINIEYGLNINWLLCNEGAMFTQPSPENLDADYVMMPLSQGLNEIVAQHMWIIQLLQIPVIKKVIVDRLELLKKEFQSL